MPETVVSNRCATPLTRTILNCSRSAECQSPLFMLVRNCRFCG